MWGFFFFPPSRLRVLMVEAGRLRGSLRGKKWPLPFCPFSAPPRTHVARDWLTSSRSWANESCDPGGRVNARSQFARNTFHAYYTVISKSFLSPGTATPAILAAVPCKAGKASETILFAVIYDPPPHTHTLLPQLLRFVCTDVPLVCFPCIPSPLFWVFFLLELVIFFHLESWPSVCRFVCECACVRVHLQKESNWKQEGGGGSNSVYPRRLFSKHGMHGRTIVFC